MRLQLEVVVMLKHTDWDIADYIADDIRFDGEVWMGRNGNVGINLFYEYSWDAHKNIMKVLLECADAAGWFGNATISFNDTTLRYRHI